MSGSAWLGKGWVDIYLHRENGAGYDGKHCRSDVAYGFAAQSVVVPFLLLSTYLAFPFLALPSNFKSCTSGAMALVPNPNAVSCGVHAQIQTS